MTKETAKTVADRLSQIVVEVLDNMEDLVGPLSETERSYVVAVLNYEIQGVMLRRLKAGHFIGSDGTEDIK